MDDLYINNTESTPEINFKGTGELSIKGKSLPEDPKKFYDPIFKWADDFSADNVELNIQLEYVNTSSSKRIIELVKSLDNNRKIKELKMNWFYEEDDSDMLEFGEMIQHSLRRTKANYIEIEDDYDDDF
jgi:hypothetical protein